MVFNKTFAKMQLTLTLLIFWMLLTLEFTPINLVIGVAVASVLGAFTQRYIYTQSDHTFKIPNLFDILHFMMHLLIEVYLASFEHIKRIIHMDHNPTLIELELEVDDPLIVTLIANAITMTPGTITVDAENRKLTILTIRDKPEDIQRIQAMVKDKLESIFID